jgi:hypothetical protein
MRSLRSPGVVSREPLAFARFGSPFASPSERLSPDPDDASAGFDASAFPSDESPPHSKEASTERRFDHMPFPTPDPRLPASERSERQ